MKIENDGKDQSWRYGTLRLDAQRRMVEDNGYNKHQLLYQIQQMSMKLLIKDNLLEALGHSKKST